MPPREKRSRPHVDVPTRVRKLRNSLFVVPSILIIYLSLPRTPFCRRRERCLIVAISVRWRNASQLDSETQFYTFTLRQRHCRNALRRDVSSRRVIDVLDPLRN